MRKLVSLAPFLIILCFLLAIIACLSTFASDQQPDQQRDQSVQQQGQPEQQQVQQQNKMVIRGSVIDEKGEALAQHRLEFSREKGDDQGMETIELETDANGCYNLELPISGEDVGKPFALRVFNPGTEGLWTEWNDTISEGEKEKDFQITRYGTIVVRVVNEDGTPVPAGVPVWFTSAGPENEDGRGIILPMVLLRIMLLTKMEKLRWNWLRPGVMTELRARTPCFWEAATTLILQDYCLMRRSVDTTSIKPLIWKITTVWTILPNFVMNWWMLK